MLRVELALEIDVVTFSGDVGRKGLLSVLASIREVTITTPA